MDGLILLGADYCLSAQGELFIRLNWQTLKPVASMFAAQLDIVDQDGRRLRQGQRSQIQMAKVGENRVQYLSVKVPDAQPPSKGGDLYAVLHLTGVLNEAYLPIVAPGVTMRDHAIELLNLSKTSRTAKIDPELKENRLEFVGEDANQILLYRNNQALPQAYLTDSVLIANSLEDACQKFASQGFNPHQKTILEGQETIAPLFQGGFQIAQSVTRENASKVLIKATAPSECYLILTDTFYNGWQAFLDDKPVVTYRANVSFRAVKLPAGRHTVRFEFIPFSFFAGLAVSILSILILGFTAWFNFRKYKKPENG
jgi:hypothetical protein